MDQSPLMILYNFIPIMCLSETAFFEGFYNITYTLKQPN